MKPWERGWGSMTVSPEEQRSRDVDRLAILEDEYQSNPSDPALIKEITLERAKQKQSPVKPWERKWESSAAPAPEAPKKPTVLTKTTRQIAADTLAQEPWYKRALIGAGKSVADVFRTVGVLPEGDKEIDAAIADDTAGFLGNLGGDIAITAVPAGAIYRGTQGIKMLPKAAQTIVGGAASGAAAEGMLNRDPVTGAVTGAILGPVVERLAAGAGSLSKGVQRLMGGAEGEAVGKVHQLFKGRVPATVAALRSTQPLVPGEVVTAGKAATHDFPELAVMEAGARTRPNAVKFTQADEATARARTKVLEDIEAPGVRPIDPATGRELESAAQSLRSGATGPLYQSAMSDLVPIPSHLERAMLGSGTVGTATNNAMREFQEAVRLARAGGQQVPAGGRAAPGRPFQQMSIDQLQRVLKQLDEIPITQRDYNVTNARRQISELMKKNSQNYDTATTLYRQMSAPQNQADVATVLRNKMNSPANDVAQRATAFTQALRDAPSTFKKADLSNRFQTLDEVFQGNQAGLQGIRNVSTSLERDALVNSLPKNKGIVPEYQSLFDVVEKAAPNLINRYMSIARSGLKKMAGMADEKVQQIIDDALTDPNKFADLLEKIPPTERNQLVNMLRDQIPNVPRATGAAVISSRKAEE